MEFDLEYLEQLADIIKKNNLSEITIGEKEKSITLKRENNRMQNKAIVPSTEYNAVSDIVVETNKESKNIKTENQHIGKPILSPMTGTFYSSPSPEAKPFVTVGDSVSVGQIVCIIEAMKLMNEIESDVSGNITEICVNNGDNIEPGQVLMYVQ